MRKIRFFNVLIFAVLSIFISCDFTDNENEPRYGSISGTFALDGAIPVELVNVFSKEKMSRSVFPSITEDVSIDLKVFDNTNPDNKIEQEDVEIKFVNGNTGFELKKIPFEKKIVVVVYVKSDSKVILKGESNEVTLSKDSPVGSFAISVSPLMSEDTEGKVDLSIAIPKTVKGVTGIRNGVESFPVSIDSDDKTKCEILDSFPTGNHTVTINFYDSEDTANGKLLYTLQESVNVFENLVSNTWVKSGDEPYLFEEDNGDGTSTCYCRITQQIIDAFEMTTFFVSEQEGSSDTDNSGTLVRPFRTLSKALSVCPVDGTVYVIGTVTTDSIVPSKNVTIRGYGDDPILKRSETESNSLIKVNSGIHVNLENIILDGDDKSIPSNGAGINNEGVLTLNNVTIKNCISTGKGSGVYQNGTMYVKGNTKFEDAVDLYLEDGKLLELQEKLDETSNINIKVSDETAEALEKVVEGKNVSSDYKKLHLLNFGYQIESSGYINYIPVYIAGSGSSVSGSDTDGDGSEERPFSTVKKAFEEKSDFTLFKVAGETKEKGMIEINKKVIISQWEDEQEAVIKRDTSYRQTMFKTLTTGELDLRHVTIHGGSYATACDGSGIYNNGILKCTDVVITYCKTSGEYKGGAIYNKGAVYFYKDAKNNYIGNPTASYNASGSNSCSCYSAYGAAIYTETDMILENLTIIYNYVYKNGLVYGLNCKISIGDVSFEKNGGNFSGIYINQGSVNPNIALSEDNTFLIPANYENGATAIISDDSEMINTAREHIQLLEFPSDSYWQIDSAGKLFKVTDIKDCLYCPVSSGELNLSDSGGYEKLVSFTSEQDKIKNVTIKLANNLTGVTQPLKYFNGTFDGNSKSITVDLSGKTGLFTNMNGTVKNLTLKGTSTYAGFAANASGEIDNCINEVKVSSSNKAAGFVLHSDGMTIKNCVNRGDISVSTTNSYENYSAGIISEAYDCKISNCNNYGVVTGDFKAGGIVGDMHGGTVKNCINENTVKITTTKEDNSDAQNNLFRRPSIGGIVSRAYGGTIDNCYNKGSIEIQNKAGIWAGGILGMVYGTDSRYIKKIQNCLNTGNITQSSASYCKIGAIYGGDGKTNGSTNVTLDDATNNYYLNGSSAKGCGSSDDIEGKYTSYSSGENAYVVNKLTEWIGTKTGYSAWSYSGAIITLNNGI